MNKQIKSKAKHEHLVDCPSIINIGVVIVSTTRYKEFMNKLPSTEKCLPVIREILSQPILLDVKTKYNIIFEKIISDNSSQLKEIIEKYTDPKEKMDVLIFSGGTGITVNDITIETVEPYFMKTMPGFGEIFRYLSYNDIGNSTILSRATAGVVHNTVVFLLPGSPNAVKIALGDIIAPELPHVMSEIYRELKKDYRAN
jgi:molybdenum cofactor biosynthesis protein B